MRYKFICRAVPKCVIVNQSAQTYWKTLLNCVPSKN